MSRVPVHDWTRVTAGDFHSFHLSWTAELLRALNAEVLPTTHYAMTLQAAEIDERPHWKAADGENDVVAKDAARMRGGKLASEMPPRTSLNGNLAEAAWYAAKARTLIVRRDCDGRTVAMVKIASPGDKFRASSVAGFVRKATDTVANDVHLVMVDLFPPGPFDPRGLCGTVWDSLGGEPLDWPADKPLAGLSVRRAESPECFAEPFAAGDVLSPLPMFYDAHYYVELPLERTYAAAWKGVPKCWRRVLEADQ